MTAQALQVRDTSALASYVPAIGRLLIAVIFLLSGAGKVFAPGGTQAYIAAAGLPLPVVAYLIAVIVEVGGGLLLVLGYQTRAAAAVLIVFTIATALGFHNNFAEQNQMIHFLKNIAIAGGLLQVVAFGAGGFSLDARRS
ncbi:DoxX family protein [Bradyrhizobium prioriisuperbiae]|uniref:DoxX family protein n=1 Tax=Bradyrhizobium prioriisuperbiae TaxID=2854389 RepID=UPI0028EA1CAF|nr:DoxX family protein [Bradyrhizobium prioritasuperba]